MSNDSIQEFLDGKSFAVAGASTDREKYGNKVLRVYMQHDRKVYPLNPKAEEVEGLAAYPDLAALPGAVHGVSLVTPPAVTEAVVQQAIDLGIRHLWMQPGAESEEAIALATEHGLNVIHSGPCILVVLGYRES
jgi:predicted CoA-binding protein